MLKCNIVTSTSSCNLIRFWVGDTECFFFDWCWQLQVSLWLQGLETLSKICSHGLELPSQLECHISPGTWGAHCSHLLKRGTVFSVVLCTQQAHRVASDQHLYSFCTDSCQTASFCASCTVGLYVSWSTWIYYLLHIYQLIS